MGNYDKFIQEIYRITKIDLSLYKEKQMKRRIKSLIRRNELNNFSDYLQLLRKSNVHLEQFLNHITINVSEFFRNPAQWKVLENEIIPSLIADKRGLKVWSSACASGEEPYSLAIMFKEMGISGIDILATDIDLQALSRARHGIYMAKSLDNMDKSTIKKYFSETQGGYAIKDSIKKMVSFRNIDLLKDNFPNNMDLILCRNVMIYFTEEAKAILYSKFHRALSEKGIFFVGSTEQIIVPQEHGFSSVKSFFYEKI